MMSKIRPSQGIPWEERYLFSRRMWSRTFFRVGMKALPPGLKLFAAIGLSGYGLYLGGEYLSQFFSRMAIRTVAEDVPLTGVGMGANAGVRAAMSADEENKGKGAQGNDSAQVQAIEAQWQALLAQAEGEARAQTTSPPPADEQRVVRNNGTNLLVPLVNQRERGSSPVAELAGASGSAKEGRQENDDLISPPANSPAISENISSERPAAKPRNKRSLSAVSTDNPMAAQETFEERNRQNPLVVNSPVTSEDNSIEPQSLKQPINRNQLDSSVSETIDEQRMLNDAQTAINDKKVIVYAENPESKSVVDYLKKNGFPSQFIHPEQTEVSELLGLTSLYLESDDKEFVDKIHQLAAAILNVDISDDNSENFSSELAISTVSQWFLKTALGTSPETFIFNQIKNKCPAINVKNLGVMFSMYQRCIDNLIECNHPFMRPAFKKVYDYFTQEAFPFLSLNIQHREAIAKIKLNSLEFTYLYTGSRFLADDKTLTDVSHKEIIKTGEEIWTQVLNDQNKVVPLEYLRLPAQLHVIHESDEVLDDVNKIESYAHYIKDFQQAQKVFAQKVTAYEDAVKAWKSRRKIAEEIIDHYYEQTDFDKHAGSTGGQAGLSRDNGREVLIQKYMNKEELPPPQKQGRRPPPKQLDEIYKGKTNDIADKFALLDESLIKETFNNLTEEEQRFIFAENALIKPVTFKMSGTLLQTGGHLGAPPIDNKVIVSLKKTDLFSVTVNGETRIYALKETHNDCDGPYKLIQVDRDINNYIKHGILNYDDFGEDYALQTRTNSYSGEEIHSLRSKKDNLRFDYKIEESDNPVPGNNGIDALTKHLTEKHRNAIYDSLYKSGYDLSAQDKIWEIGKSLIPFYECVEGIIERDASKAAPACLLDILSLFTLAGRVGTLTGRFGMALHRGLRSGASVFKQSGLKGAVKELMNSVAVKGALPTGRELAGVGVEAASIFDPGFKATSDAAKAVSKEIIDGINGFKQRVIEALSVNPETANLASKLKATNPQLAVPTGPERLTGLTNTADANASLSPSGIKDPSQSQDVNASKPLGSSSPGAQQSLNERVVQGGMINAAIPTTEANVAARPQLSTSSVDAVPSMSAAETQLPAMDNDHHPVSTQATDKPVVTDNAPALTVNAAAENTAVVLPHNQVDEANASQALPALPETTSSVQPDDAVTQRYTALPPQQGDPRKVENVQLVRKPAPPVNTQQSSAVPMEVDDPDDALQGSSQGQPLPQEGGRTTDEPIPSTSGYHAGSANVSDTEISGNRQPSGEPLADDLASSIQTARQDVTATIERLISLLNERSRLKLSIENLTTRYESQLEAAKKANSLGQTADYGTNMRLADESKGLIAVKTEQEAQIVRSLSECESALNAAYARLIDFMSQREKALSEFISSLTTKKMETEVKMNESFRLAAERRKLAEAASEQNKMVEANHYMVLRIFAFNEFILHKKDLEGINQDLLFQQAKHTEVQNQLSELRRQAEQRQPDRLQSAVNSPEQVASPEQPVRSISALEATVTQLEAEIVSLNTSFLLAQDQMTSIYNTKVACEQEKNALETAIWHAFESYMAQMSLAKQARIEGKLDEFNVYIGQSNRALNDYQLNQERLDEVNQRLSEINLKYEEANLRCQTLNAQFDAVWQRYVQEELALQQLQQNNANLVTQPQPEQTPTTTEVTQQMEYETNQSGNDAEIIRQFKQTMEAITQTNRKIEEDIKSLTVLINSAREKVTSQRAIIGSYKQKRDSIQVIANRYFDENLKRYTQALRAQRAGNTAQYLAYVEQAKLSWKAYERKQKELALLDQELAVLKAKVKQNILIHNQNRLKVQRLRREYRENWQEYNETKQDLNQYQQLPPSVDPDPDPAPLSGQSFIAPVSNPPRQRPDSAYNVIPDIPNEALNWSPIRWDNANSPSSANVNTEIQPMTRFMPLSENGIHSPSASPGIDFTDNLIKETNKTYDGKDWSVYGLNNTQSDDASVLPDYILDARKIIINHLDETVKRVEEAYKKLSSVDENDIENSDIGIYLATVLKTDNPDVIRQSFHRLKFINTNTYRFLQASKRENYKNFLLVSTDLVPDPEIGGRYISSLNTEQLNDLDCAMTIPDDSKQRILIYLDKFYQPNQMVDADRNALISTTITHEVTHIAGSTGDYSLFRDPIEGGRLSVPEMFYYFEQRLQSGELVNSSDFDEFKERLKNDQAILDDLTNEQLIEALKKDDMLRANFLLDDAEFVTTLMLDIADRSL